MDCKLRCQRNEKGETEMRDMREPAIQLNKISASAVAARSSSPLLGDEVNGAGVQFMPWIKLYSSPDEMRCDEERDGGPAAAQAA